MSNIYIQEPPTNGKVCLKTSVGDLEIELWSKECPKACRNFVQLCLENFYDGTIFHRVVPGFIVQGGDPTGTGCGGDSIYGQPFKDEFHSRLRFVRRGLVAMANGGKSNDNASQFFFTLDKAPELQGKHTIFGQVVGDTLYNMLKLAECEVDKNERPENPHKILKTEVISNPFPDITPRASSEGQKISLPLDDKAERKKATKNFNLLSFGDEAEEEEVLYQNINRSLSSKGKSSFGRRNNVETAKETETEEPESRPDQLGHENMLSKVQEKLKANKDAKNICKLSKRRSDDEEEDMHKIITDQQTDGEKARLSALKEETRQLRKELFAKNDPIEKQPDQTGSQITNPELEVFHNERQIYKAKQGAARKTAERQEQVYEMLKKFKNKLAKTNEGLSATVDVASGKNEPVVEKETSKSVKRPLAETDEDDIPESHWLHNTFHVSTEEKPLKEAIDVHTKDEQRYSMDDPRNPMNKRRSERKHGKRDKDRKREKS